MSVHTLSERQSSAKSGNSNVKTRCPKTGNDPVTTGPFFELKAYQIFKLHKNLYTVAVSDVRSNAIKRKT